MSADRPDAAERLLELSGSGGHPVTKGRALAICVHGLKALTKMPCLADLLGEGGEIDGCGCASCQSKYSLEAAARELEGPMSEKATPRPWKVDGAQIRMVGRCGTPGHWGCVVAEVIAVHEHPEGTGRANAALIVKAVNSYEAFQQMREALRELLTSPVSFGDERLDYDERQVHKAAWAAGNVALSAADALEREK